MFQKIVCSYLYSSDLPWLPCIVICIYIYICAYEEKIIANVSWGKRNLFTTVTWSVIQVALSSWLEERCTKAPQIKTVCVL